MEAYFNGTKYTGKAAYINGFNGYTSTDDDGLLCALVVDSVGVLSCWGKDGKPNALKDKNGNNIINHNARGSVITFV